MDTVEELKKKALLRKIEALSYVLAMANQPK